MKSFSWKYLLAGVAAIGLAAVAYFTIFSTRTPANPVMAMDPAFGEYISAYTAGVIPASATLRIEFTRDMVDSSAAGKPASGKLFSISPSLSGSTTWINPRTVEFKPEKPMKSGQIFHVDFYLGKLIDVSTALETFTYEFQVIPQNFEITVDNIKPYVKTELKRQKIEGTLTTADVANSVDVEKVLTGNQFGKDLKISWIHNSDGRQHGFVVEEVVRTETANQVKLIAAGAPIDVERTETKEVEIPSLSDFKIMQTRVVQNPNQYLVLQFSDPLQEGQNLTGLITIDGAESPTLEVHDNEIYVYPVVRLNGTKNVLVSAGIRNILGYRMKNPITVEVVFEQLSPAVRFTGEGVILPSTNGLVLPFEAVNLNAVDLKIRRIYENNVLQFLQVNDLNGNQEMHRVGRNVLTKKISLENSGVTDFGKWNRFTLDLAKLIQTEPGALYEVKIGFKRSYSTYQCQEGYVAPEEEDLEVIEEEPEYGEYYYEDEYYYYDDYDWSERDNPCNGSYYSGSRTIRKNLLASDLGITAKQGENGVTEVVIANLLDTKPVADAEVELLDYQQQILVKGNTNADGMVTLQSKRKPYFLLVRSGSQRGYLKLASGEALPLSNFEVSGTRVEKGIKGFIYGDRGVWRPGDSLYLNFVLEDKTKTLPAAHPVIFELQNPQGQIVSRIVRSTSENNFYNFSTVTSEDAPTGNWLARVKVGGTEFTQRVKIETVKPNRLKIRFDLGTEFINSENIPAKLHVDWLHGAVGAGLKANIDLTLAEAATTFKGYNGYSFVDESRSFGQVTETIFSGNTDMSGDALVNIDLKRSTLPPGFLNAVFQQTVFEEGGDFSTDRFALTYSPYRSYVGIKAPEGESYSRILYLDKSHSFDIASVEASGKPLTRNLDYTLYKLNWRWWWDNSSADLANYMESSYTQLIKSGSISTQGGKGKLALELKSAEHKYGRYFLKVCDPESGHCASQVVYFDTPDWWSRSESSGERGGSNLLTFTTDREVYKPGDIVKVNLPKAKAGRILLSIENGTRVIQKQWVDVTSESPVVTFKATEEMTPNVFIHLSMIQPHSQTENDLPIRLYGVRGIKVENPETHLQPEITMPEVLEPGERVTIKVSEKSDRKMTYTLAIVDDGLLDLTRFKTPDPWNSFYAPEALGVATWDVYDDVIGAYGAKLERLLAVGGGDAEFSLMKSGDDDNRAKRFKPVVKFFGPFTLNGGKATHSFVMPAYIGSVRTMLVAGNEGAYGSAEKTTPVRKPLMVLATLPRVLGPSESVTLPVTLFTQEKNLRNVKVEVKVSGPAALTSPATQQVTIPSTGELTTDFQLGVRNETGFITVEIKATSGNNVSTEKVQIEIRNPNTPVTKAIAVTLEPGKTWSGEVQPFGISGTNSALVEVSTLPPLNLSSRMRYLMEYPHGCIEQTTSAVFPQLYLGQLKELTDVEKREIQRNVTAGIERIRTFIQSDGGFGYWPGRNEHSDSWGTSYAGHFLLEAEAKGYFVSEDILRRWKKYQRNAAAAWRHNDYYSSDLVQAYRLYTMALAGIADLGSMNRLREQGGLSTTTAWTLAAAYARAGQTETANQLIAKLSTVIKPYRELYYSYGSNVRDMALILETLTLMKDQSRGILVMKELAKYVGDSGYWLSTQEAAYALKSIAMFAGNQEKNQNINFDYTINGASETKISTLPVTQLPLKITGTRKEALKLVNRGTGVLFVRIIQQGTPARGAEQDEFNGLALTVKYTTREGAPLDISTLNQGTTFLAEVSVAHAGVTRQVYENLALSQVFPSGWEINNLRLTGDEGNLRNSWFNYQDIRDDRVYTYFGLAPGERKSFQVMLTATYAGKFYLPAVSVEAMYDKTIFGRISGKEVVVTRPAIN